METKKKWALVAWEKVCRPKRKGGLGLHDPQVTNNAYGVKLWGCWVKETTTPWVNLWKAKYALDIRDQDKIRFRGTREGPSIWNLDWHNKAWIQTNNFWEIRDGRSTFFGEDSLQQLPKIQDNPNYMILKYILKEGQGKKVHHYQNPNLNSLDQQVWSICPDHIPL